MKESKTKVDLKKLDLNPKSKRNTEFRKRHDISIIEFNRYCNNYQRLYA